MGLSTPTAIYQARFAKYLERRGLKPANGGKIWTFIGDGESDEPEVLGTINIAAREQLDNLVLVVNCNLQRLDGPVRGNGKIIQELERSFRGAGWNVIKVIWSGEWDKLFAIDREGVLQDRMEQAVDGDYQMYSVSSGEEVRDHWVGDDAKNSPKSCACFPTKKFAVFAVAGTTTKRFSLPSTRPARKTNGPTVILIKTIKGYGMQGYEGSNAVHQKKNLSRRRTSRYSANRLGILESTKPRPARQTFTCHPADSEEMTIPEWPVAPILSADPGRQRTVDCPALHGTRSLTVFKDQVAGSGERELSTTMAFVRMLSKLLDHPDLGKLHRADRARRSADVRHGSAVPQGRHLLGRRSEVSPRRQLDPDALPRSGRTGRSLQEGICEAGAMASFLAAGTAYAVHGVPTIPFYVFYSIFGFQRVGDMIWSCGDMLSRGFLLGGTSGRTTLNGEGLQHEDGHSQVIANTVPNMLSYDPVVRVRTCGHHSRGHSPDVPAAGKRFLLHHRCTTRTMRCPPCRTASTDGISASGMYCYSRSAM